MLEPNLHEMLFSEYYKIDDSKYTYIESHESTEYPPRQNYETNKQYNIPKIYESMHLYMTTRDIRMKATFLHFVGFDF